MTTTKREIVDNETDNYTMGRFLNENISKQNSKIDIASGYFNPSGFNILRKALWETSNSPQFSFRLLFGRDAVQREYSTAEVFGSKSVSVSDQPLTEEIDSLKIGERPAEIVDDLIKFLRLQSVAVRRNEQRFNHAKCYILDEVVGVGSSNFTGSGLSANVELNAILYQPSAQQEVRNWFERRWNEGNDTKLELIQLLEESKFGAPLDPFVVYMKFLYEYYKPRLQELEQNRGKLELATFQEDAVRVGMHIINKYGGVIIADSTGLGKTHIGLELLRELVAVQRKKALLLAPSQVIDTVWEPKLRDASIKTANESIEGTGTTKFRPEEYLDYDVVLIDESHNYRNAVRNRYVNLMKLLSGGKRKQIILQTATPVNNSLLDLYNQITLITGGDDAHFLELDIPDLKHHFLSADKKKLATGIEDIVRLLDAIMIRRTRQFIKENYPDATINAKPVTFPKRKLKKVEYTLTQIFGTTVYRQVLDTIDQLNLVPYRISTYIKHVEKEEKLEAEHRANLQKFGLLKRFESSIAAIKKSIERLVRFYELFETAMFDGHILDSKSFHRLVSEIEEEDEDDEEKLFQKLDEMMKEKLLPITNEYNVKKMREDVIADLNLLRPLKKGLDNIHPYSDRKLSRLKELFDEDHIFEQGGKKVVIFTQFVDTAKYLNEELKETMKGHEVRLLTGQTDTHTRKLILEGFAPKANNAPLGTKPINILCSTDVLSEGQNLQDSNYCINYDLPWNPMKIVQRVGRIDRMMSDFPEVFASVFLPEKELEDILGLLEKLEEKIQKVSSVVGIEATILGERENPKNFNALSRIRANDDTLLDEMELGQELLPPITPFQFIQSYLKKMGKERLESIPLGKRSGKKSDVNGMALFYREKKNLEGIHLLFYDYEQANLDHINDVTWIFRKIACKEDELLKIPVEGFEAFKHFRIIDEKAKNRIMTELNAPMDAREGLKIKPHHQRELAETLLELFRQGKLPKDKTQPVYDVLLRQNLVAWEEELGLMLADYKNDKNAEALLSAVDTLLHIYKIEARKPFGRKKLSPEDLEIIGYTFLSKEGEFPLLAEDIPS